MDTPEPDKQVVPDYLRMKGETLALRIDTRFLLFALFSTERVRRRMKAWLIPPLLFLRHQRHIAIYNISTTFLRNDRSLNELVLEVYLS